MRAIWSGAISFGLVTIPTKLYSGTQSNKLEFHLLREDDHCPIKFERVCRSDGKEVPFDNIVKGYEYEEGDYVVLSKEDFDKANVEKSSTIDIQDFVNESEVDSIFYEKPYFLAPDKNGEKSYALLRDALKTAKKVAVASFVMRSRENIGVIKPYGKLLVLNQLRYHDEIRDSGKLDLPDEKKAGDKELKMALALIDQMTAKFKPEDYADSYIEDLKRIIETKQKGKKPKAKGKKPQTAKVVDIMSQLKKSIEENKKSAA